MNPLQHDDPAEDAIFARGARNTALKKEEMKRSLMAAPPTATESQMLHSLYLRFASPFPKG